MKNRSTRRERVQSHERPSSTTSRQRIKGYENLKQRMTNG